MSASPENPAVDFHRTLRPKVMSASWLNTAGFDRKSGVIFACFSLQKTVFFEYRHPRFFPHFQITGANF
jgi:hypothetical protein